MDHDALPSPAVNAARAPLRRGLGLFLIIVGLVLANVLLTRTAHAAESVAQDLQRIVVLCATEPASDRFDQAWTAWLMEHPNADVESTIRTVITRAGTIRSMSLVGAEPTPPRRHPSRDTIAEHMRMLASSARRAHPRSVVREAGAAVEPARAATVPPR